MNETVKNDDDESVIPYWVLVNWATAACAFAITVLLDSAH